MATKYKLTDTQVRHLAIICYREQGSNDAGVRACASQMCNYYELYQEKNFKNVYECVFGSGWYWNRSKNEEWVKNHPNVPESVVSAVKDVIVYGKRTLPEYVVEYDCLSDVKTATNNGQWFPPEDRKQYKKNITKITNVYGSSYTFYCFPDGAGGYCDAFGYFPKDVGKQTEEKPTEEPESHSVSVKLPELRKGSVGIAVSVMQSILILIGYNGRNGFDLEIDGGFGSDTEYAVREFQDAAGIKSDGVCGRETWARLKDGMVI